MRTHSIIESANIVINDYQDFVDYSVEKEIISFLETPKIVSIALTNQITEKGQSNEPSLKEKEPVVEDTTKETLKTPGIVKANVLKV